MKRSRPDLKFKKKTEVINIDYFFAKFEKEKRRYPPSFFCTDKEVKAKRTQFVDFRLYKKIVLEYFKMYFFDFYMTQKAIYFPLGGFMKKVRFDSGVKSQRKKKAYSDGAIGFFWYQRPSKKMAYMVLIKKLTGSSNRIPKIEELYKSNFNKDLLPIFDREIKKQYANKNMYICSLT